MQLRRGPPGVLSSVAKVPALRLVKPPAEVRTPAGWKASALFRSYTLRVVAAIMLVSIPLSIVLGLVMSNWSAQTSIDQTKARAEATAESAAVRIQDWVSERQGELRALAQDEAGKITTTGLQAHLLAAAASHPAFA